MARRGRRGSLSRKTYFPATGDQLQSTDNGLLWECAKSNTAQTPRGEKVRYGLLVGHIAGEDEEIILSIDDRDDRGWLDEVDTIHRRVNPEIIRSYLWNPETSSWQQKLED
jgi:hypothetical protein